VGGPALIPAPGGPARGTSMYMGWARPKILVSEAWWHFCNRCCTSALRHYAWDYV